MQIHGHENSTSLRGWVVVGLLLSLATLAGLLLADDISLTSQAMIYVLAVVLAAYRLAWVESVACAIGAVTALNFFFVPPRWTLEVENREHFIALGVMLVVALVISHLANGLRRETGLARRNEERARQLQSLASELALVGTTAQVHEVGLLALQSAFAGPCALALAGSNGLLAADEGQPAELRNGLAACLRENAVLGPGTGRWPGLLAWYLPLPGPARPLGAACVRPALSADHAGREHAQAICALLGQSLARLGLAESVKQAREQSHRQQLQNTLLAAISHDLRTPLAAMVTAATALQTQRARLKPDEQDRLLASIVGEAAYLDALTDNTLQWVRLGSPDGAIQRQWESVEEIVGAVLARVRRHEATRRIRASVPPGLPLIHADAVLLSQLLANLLDNALHYSDGDVDLNVQLHADAIEVGVHDRGPGIAPGEREAVFQPYVRGDRSGRRGTGLGLAVCRAIAQAHQAELKLLDRPGGGASFVLRLPLQPQPSAPHAETTAQPAA